jgi:hypothetical protein
MASKFIPALTAGAAALIVVILPARADDTGLAYSHDMRREKGRLCFSDHWHFGSGAGGTRGAAEIEAIKSWADFTALEYGSDWARYSRAAGKTVKCAPNGSGGYDCQIDARPCK